MSKLEIFISLLLLLTCKDVFSAATDGDYGCNSDSMHLPSFVEMEKFTRLDGALRRVIARALMEDWTTYKVSCEIILDEGLRIKENYMRDLECTAMREISEHGNLDIDKFLTILKYWCGLNENVKNAFFKIDTLQCLRDTKTDFEDCVGYFAHKSKFSRRDYCSNKDSAILTNCVKNVVWKKCSEKSAGNVKIILDDILGYSKNNLQCGKEHLLWKYYEVLSTIEYL